MFLYIIPFENLDQFILKFGVIYLAIKLNVLSSIDATRWKLDFYKIKLNFTTVKVFSSVKSLRWMSRHGRNFFKKCLFSRRICIVQDSRDFDGQFKKSPLYTILGGLFLFGLFNSRLFRCLFLDAIPSYFSIDPFFIPPVLLYHLSIIIICFILLKKKKDYY